MLDLYNTISTDPQPLGFSYYKPVLPTQVSPMVTAQDSRFLDDADMVMSFVNLSKFTVFSIAKTKDVSKFVGYEWVYSYIAASNIWLSDTLQ